MTKEQHAERIHKWVTQNPDRHRIHVRRFNLKNRYGITLEEYESILQKQGGVCAICHKVPNGKFGNKRLHVDHDHKTGKIRGLLCHHCNRGVGMFYDDVEKLESAILYLKAHQCAAIPTEDYV